MDESDEYISEVSNNGSDTEKELGESESGTIHEKDGATEFEYLLTRPISSASAPTNVLENFSASLSFNDVSCNKDHWKRTTDTGESVALKGLIGNDSNDGKSDNEFETVPKTNIEKSILDSPFLASIERRYLSLKQSLDNTENLFQVDVDSTVGNSVTEINNELSIESLLAQIPDLPTTEPSETHSRTDGQSVSDTSSFNKAYINSSVSVDLPNKPGVDCYRLIPKFDIKGEGFCWPIDKLPLSGNRRFDEGTQWTTSHQIGFGARGQCFSGCPVNNKGVPFCVKKCEYKLNEVLSLCLAAKEIPPRIGAENIVMFYGATYARHNCCIFMEFMEGGTVEDEIKEHPDGLQRQFCVDYFKDVLMALEFIHGKGMIHNDVKAANVLLGASKLQARLADFGEAAEINSYNTKSKDIRSGGNFLLDMLGVRHPSGLIRRGGMPSSIPNTVTDQDTRKVLEMCFSENTASAILKCNFFRINNFNC